MIRLTRNVRDLAADERRMYEDVIGRELAENQQVILQVVTVDPPPAQSEPAQTVPALPDWTRVYEGLSEEELAAVENVILQRCDLTRTSE